MGLVEMQAKIIDWVRQQMNEPDPPKELTDDTDLVSSGLLDSLSLMQLITFIEDEYNLKIPAEAMTPDNFSTPKSITTLVSLILAESSQTGG